MAVITPVRSSPAHNVEQILWETLTNSDTATPIRPAGLATMAGSVQFTGTIGTSVTLECSNDGTNYVTMKDTQGNDISATAAGIYEFATAALYIRPGQPTGTSDVDVTIILRNQ